jgi:hypothetical protein
MALRRKNTRKILVRPVEKIYFPLAVRNSAKNGGGVMDTLYLVGAAVKKF